MSSVHVQIREVAAAGNRHLVRDGARIRSASAGDWHCDNASIKKSPSEMSKKMLPAPFTLMRPLAVEMFVGKVTASDPSFGVPASSVVG